MKKLVTGLILGSLLLTACSKGGDSSKDEKQRFIDASVEVACMVFEAEDPNIDWEAKTKEIFANHGFDVEDDAGMNAIAAKYENDVEVEEALTKAMEECAGDLFDAMGDLEILDAEGGDAEGGE